MDTLKNRLDYAIKKAGKRQIDLSNDLGIPKSAISQYLSGSPRGSWVMHRLR